MSIAMTSYSSTLWAGIPSCPKQYSIYGVYIENNMFETVQPQTVDARPQETLP